MSDPFLPSCVVGSCYLYLFVDKNPILSLFMPYHQVCNKSNITGGTNGGVTVYPSEGPPVYSGIRVAYC